MLTRRDVLVGAVTSGCLCGFSHKAFGDQPLVKRTDTAWPEPTRLAGCSVGSLDDVRQLGDVRQLQEAGIPPEIKVANATFPGRKFRIAAGTGNKYFDRALAESLLNISKTFGVLPTVGFVVDSPTPQAFATNKQYKPEAGDADLPVREDGSVMLSTGIIQYLQKKGIKDMAAAAIIVCAHEFGHIVQFRYAFEKKLLESILNDGQPNVRRGELHADFLAGYYVGLSKKRNPHTPAATVAMAAHLLGDMNPTKKEHHGTPKERGEAVYAGYKVGFETERKFSEAVILGLRHVGV